MKIFISINGLKCGGAEKSLISFINDIPESYIDSNALELDLLVLEKNDYFFTDIPKWVNWLKTDPYIDGMFETTKEHFSNPVNPIVFYRKIASKIRMKIRSCENASRVQHIWDCWKDIIPAQKKDYDLAISYVDGFSNYYVMDKVNARKKILWVHNEYEKLNYNQIFDSEYFTKADAIVTISDKCVESLVKNFPMLRDKIWMIPNISSQKTIWKMSEEPISERIENDNFIVSVGRLNEQKGFDLAIDVAEILAKKISFCWYILGEGELRETLESRIREKKLEDRVYLLGNRNNPYPYLRKAGVFVQPSRFEGKSIVLDEAKILEKPIIVTNYTSASDSIVDGENGYIVEFDANKLADKIYRLLTDKKMKNMFENNLHNERMLADRDIDKYLKLIDAVTKNDL